MKSQRKRDGASSTATLGYEAQLWQMADTMAAIERDNPALKGVLPKDYARPALDKQRLGQLIVKKRQPCLGTSWVQR